MTEEYEHNPNEKLYSVSTIEDHDKCARRRWLKKICKLPVPQSTPTIFGDVAHACAARYLAADDMGRVNNLPVEIYPANWMSMVPKFGKDKNIYTITNEEAVLVKTLINKAIIGGLLIREPGRIVEREFRHTVFKKRGMTVKFIGYIDLDNPREVHDHKFVKNLNYAKSTRRGTKLAMYTDTQMMSYAWVKYEEGHKGPIDLTLLYYIKSYDQPKLNRRRVTVDEIEVRQFYNDHTLPSMQKMFEIDTKFPMCKVGDWLDVPGPCDNKECNFHYGKPCPYIMVCTGNTTPQKYLSNYGIDINELLNSEPVNVIIQEGKPKMGLMDRIKGNTDGNKAVETVVETVVPTSQVPPEAVGSVLGAVEKPNILSMLQSDVPPAEKSAIEVASQGAVKILSQEGIEEATPSLITGAVKIDAPWFFDYNGEGCKLCNNSPVRGYTDDMIPCAVCDNRRKHNNLPTSDMFDAVTNTDGTMTFTEKGSVAETTVQVVAEPTTKTTVADAPIVPAAEAHTGNLTSLLGAKNLAAVETDSTIPPVDIATAKQPLIGEIDKVVESLVGDDKKGYTLLLGCIPVKGTKNILHADELLSMLVKDIEAAGGKNINAQNHFDVLNAIEAGVAGYIEGLKTEGWNIVAFPTTKGSAMDRLVEGLRIHASVVITPMGV